MTSCGRRSESAAHAPGAFDVEGSLERALDVAERAFDVEGGCEGAFDVAARIEGASRVDASAGVAPKSSKSSLGLSTPCPYPGDFLRVGLPGVRVGLPGVRMGLQGVRVNLQDSGFGVSG